LTTLDQAALIIKHRDAALLIGQKNYSAGIRSLQAMVDSHPELVVVAYQLASALMRAGRLDEAIAALQEARDRQPAEAELALALADALMRADRAEDASHQADEAIALATTADNATPRRRARARGANRAGAKRR
jgi:predicted Zn-dependent protease